MIVLAKENRQARKAKFSVTGRDVFEQELLLDFEPTSCRWQLLSDDAETYKFKSNPIVKFIETLGEFNGYTQELADQYIAFSRERGLVHGLTSEKPAVSFGKKLQAISGELWRIKMSLVTETTSAGKKITIKKM